MKRERERREKERIHYNMKDEGKARKSGRVLELQTEIFLNKHGYNTTHQERDDKDSIQSEWGTRRRKDIIIENNVIVETQAQHVSGTGHLKIYAKIADATSYLMENQNCLAYYIVVHGTGTGKIIEGTATNATHWLERTKPKKHEKVHCMNLDNFKRHVIHEQLEVTPSNNVPEFKIKALVDEFEALLL